MVISQDFKPLELVELAIVVAANQNNPSILNADFLKYNGIVDKSWVAGQAAMTTPVFSQVVYPNGVSVTSVPDKLVFVQQFASDKQSDVVSEIAKNYINVLPHVEYRQVGINPKLLAMMSSPSTGDTQFVVKNFLMPGQWQSFGKIGPKAGIRLIFNLEQSTLTLSIEEGAVQTRPNDHGLIFEANFHRDLEGGTREQRKENLVTAVNGISKDLELLFDLIDNKILSRGNKACA